MDPKAKQAPLVANERQLKQTIKNFAENFQSDGFLVFGGKPQINFVGRLIVNYKGLGVLKFRKTQVSANQFNQHEFRKLCQEYIILPNKQEQLLEELHKKYQGYSYCIISGAQFKSTGQICSVNRGLTTVFLY